ncbi:hypothetical protein [Vibrio sp. E150_018]
MQSQLLEHFVLLDIQQELKAGQLNQHCLASEGQVELPGVVWRLYCSLL